MGNNRSLLTALGAILGLVLFIFIILQGVNYFREGAAEFEEMQRQAGAPILLSETLQEGGAITTTETVTETTALTDTAALTGTATITDSSAMTATTAVTGTSPATDTVVVTDTVLVTDTVIVTDTVVVTETVDAGTDAAETVVPTETVAAADTDAITTTAAVTDTAPVTETDVATEAVAVDADETVTPTVAAEEETPAAEDTAAEETEAVALAVPAPEEVAPIFTKAGCIGCHVIPEIPNAVGAVGPDLTNIGVTAATRIEGYTAEEYLYESLLEPNAFIVPECPTGACLPGLMVQNLGDVLTQEELDAVVGYLASLGTSE